MYEQRDLQKSWSSKPDVGGVDHKKAKAHYESCKKNIEKEREESQRELENCKEPAYREYLVNRIAKMGRMIDNLEKSILLEQDIIDRESANKRMFREAQSKKNKILKSIGHNPTIKG